MTSRGKVWLGCSIALVLGACGDDSSAPSNQNDLGSSGAGAGAGSAGGGGLGNATDAGPTTSTAGDGNDPLPGDAEVASPPDAGGGADAEMFDFPVSDLCPEPRGSLPMDDPAQGFLVLAAERKDPWVAHVDDSWVYFVDDAAQGDGLYRVARDGGAVETLAEGLSVADPGAHAGMLYWVGFDPTTRLRSIERIALDANAGTPEVLAEALDEAGDMVVDANGVFFTDRSAEVIYQLPLDGAAAPTVVVDSVVVQGMAGRGGYLYFTDFRRSAVVRVPTAGGPTETLSSGHLDVGSIAVTDTRVFFAASMTSLQTVPLAGGEAVSVVESEGRFDTVSVAGAQGDDLLWYRDSLRGCPILNRMRFDGTGHVGYAFRGGMGMVLDGDQGFIGLGTRDSFDPVGEVVRFKL